MVVVTVVQAKTKQRLFTKSLECSLVNFSAQGIGVPRIRINLMDSVTIKHVLPDGTQDRHGSNG
jgi:lysyl-tRNA synthetase class II